MFVSTKRWTEAGLQIFCSESTPPVFGSPDIAPWGYSGFDTHVYPGHGDDTTLGAESPHLRKWRERGW